MNKALQRPSRKFLLFEMERIAPGGGHRTCKDYTLILIKPSKTWVKDGVRFVKLLSGVRHDGIPKEDEYGPDYKYSFTYWGEYEGPRPQCWLKIMAQHPELGLSRRWLNSERQSLGSTYSDVKQAGLDLAQFHKDVAEYFKEKEIAHAG